MCSYFDVSRSGYYKAAGKADKRALDTALLVDLVQGIRRKHPRMGGKKVYEWIKGDMGKAGIKMGRDKFFEVLREKGLLVKRKRKYVYTTDSYHYFRVYKNLLKDHPLKKAHQAWVSDITYIRTSRDFMYLFLITDAYSRKIVGWHLSDSLKVEGAVSALKMAIRQCPNTEGVIHHSDRGIQYCCKDYTRLLKESKITISMTEENHCYENAMAERVNGILKQEYGLDETFNNEHLTMRAVKEAIGSYNMERPHWSLKLATPEQIHQAA
jgi:transposase InsO family protein